ncbi:hypothetical protein CEXT_234071 [Caerostris extrusa]|uniref:Uncharacterized protein n=1 Tax=Caerostris extrusa TaxID=172846 RepID=A0AAV4X475_CAEEX|nr:hypothetical protein CEXT_234071 [Caerostris extrusa]
MNCNLYRGTSFFLAVVEVHPTSGNRIHALPHPICHSLSTEPGKKDLLNNKIIEEFLNSEEFYSSESRDICENEREPSGNQHLHDEHAVDTPIFQDGKNKVRIAGRICA